MKYNDHDFDDGKFGVKSGRRVRTERSASGSYRYYISGFNPLFCVGQTSSADGFFHYQCGKKWKAKFDHRGFHFCGTHYPPTRHARAAARKAKWESEWEADRNYHKLQKELEAWRERCMEALRKIADGNLNDPAGYAAMILEDEPEKPKYDT